MTLPYDQKKKKKKFKSWFPVTPIHEHLKIMPFLVTINSVPVFPFSGDLDIK